MFSGSCHGARQTAQRSAQRRKVCFPVQNIIVVTIFTRKYREFQQENSTSQIALKKILLQT